MTDDNGRGPIGRLRALIHRRQMRPSETPANDTERDATPEERYRRRCRMIERYADRRNDPYYPTVMDVISHVGATEDYDMVRELQYSCDESSARWRIDHPLSWRLRLAWRTILDVFDPPCPLELDYRRQLDILAENMNAPDQRE